jgi:hypothetical protein
VRTGYEGAGFKGNGKPVQIPTEAQPSSSIQDSSCSVSGFHGAPQVPAIDCMSRGELVGFPSQKITVATEAVVGRMGKYRIRQITVGFIAEKTIILEQIPSDPIAKSAKVTGNRKHRCVELVERLRRLLSRFLWK